MKIPESLFSEAARIKDKNLNLSDYDYDRSSSLSLVVTTEKQNFYNLSTYNLAYKDKEITSMTNGANNFTNNNDNSFADYQSVKKIHPSMSTQSLVHSGRLRTDSIDNRQQTMCGMCEYDLSMASIWIKAFGEKIIIVTLLIL